MWGRSYQAEVVTWRAKWRLWLGRVGSRRTLSGDGRGWRKGGLQMEPRGALAVSCRVGAPEDREAEGGRKVLIATLRAAGGQDLSYSWTGGSLNQRRISQSTTLYCRLQCARIWWLEWGKEEIHIPWTSK